MLKKKRGSPSPERDPVSVGFLHTPNFAAFWPKPRKKRILGQCAGIMQTVLHLTPPLQMSGSCPKPKKNIEKSKDSGTMCWYHANLSLLHSGQNRGKKNSGTMYWYHANSSPPYPPLADVRLLSKTEKNIEKSKDAGTMCWYHANSSPPYPPPCRCQAPVQKPKKNIEKSKDFVQNQKKPREIGKKQKNPKILGQCAGIM